ncbi:MAG: alpha/beta fold hydrolase [Gemmatimonadetes bacterium]|nr:alpha/beta fold hydrolase [Gemmatimonadota bacterium]
MDPLTPVVFLHAFPLNAAMWTRQAEPLAPRQALAPHFPGFGARPPGEATLDAFARAVLADMDAAGIGRAVLVGLSMGGYTAFRMHALAPARVAGLVLAATRAGADDEAGRAKRTDQAARARREGIGWLADAMLPGLLGETTRRERPDVVAHVRSLVAQADAEGVARAQEAMRERPDSFPRLGEIRVPTLVIVGEEDTLTPPAEARRIADGVKEARLVVLPGAGHLANLEKPEAFNAVVADFLLGIS